MEIKRLPLSGSEPPPNPFYDTEKGIRNNNCYDYAIDDPQVRKHKSTPGDRRNCPHDLTYDSCYPLKNRLLIDNPGNIYREHPEKACNPDFYKIMMFVSSNKQKQEDYGDFHFYRQNKDVFYNVKRGDTVQSIAKLLDVPERTILEANKNNSILTPGSKLLVKNANLFTHKLGWATGAMVDDSCGNAIKDPRFACRKHAVDYDRFCGSYCVRKGAVKSGVYEDRLRNNLASLKRSNQNLRKNVRT